MEDIIPVRSRKHRRVAAKRKHAEISSFVASSGIPETQTTSIDVNKIPVSSESFEVIISKGMVYVDKTDIISDVLDFSSSIFIARPRKFGKSLVLEVMRHILEGSRHLFEGLKIYNKKSDWTKHAVFRFNFAQKAGDIIENILIGIRDVCIKHSIPFEKVSNISMTKALSIFEDVIQTIRDINGLEIAVLVDEYDIPIVKFIEEQEDQSRIKANSELLSQFFNEIKNNPRISKFIVTGVAKFAKTSLFSAANHLKDISFLNLASTLYGYTKEELTTYFSDYLNALASKKGQSVQGLIDDIIEYYNGYCFSFENADITLLNPFDINELLKEQSIDFKPYWIKQGRPRYFGDKPWAECVDIVGWKNTPISENNFDKFEPLPMSSSKFVPGMFLVQVGLLTIRKKGLGFYLDLPNMEIRSTFIEALVNEQSTKVLEHATLCREHIRANRIDLFVNQLKSFFACLPYTQSWRISKFEAYYHTCLYLLVALMGYNVSSEHATNTGLIDLVIEEETFVWVIELKIDKSVESALNQIEDKEYQLQFENIGKKVTKIGINFDSDSRNIDSHDYSVIEVNRTKYLDDDVKVSVDDKRVLTIESPKKKHIIQLSERTIKWRRASGFIELEGNVILDKSKPSSWNETHLKTLLKNYIYVDDELPITVYLINDLVSQILHSKSSASEICKSIHTAGDIKISETIVRTIFWWVIDNLVEEIQD